MSIKINEKDYLNKVFKTLEWSENEVNEFHSNFSSLHDYLIKHPSENSTDILQYLLFTINEAIFFPQDEVSFAELKTHIQQYTTTKISGLSIDWQDVKNVISKVNDEDKGFILGSAITFDFMDNADYMTEIEPLLENNVYSSFHLIGMTAFARPDDQVKDLFDNFIQKGENTEFPLMAAALSPIAKDWLKKEYFDSALQISCEGDSDCEYTQSLLQEISSEMFGE